MKDTIVVNLFAGPGAGKSTGAAYVFSMLKQAGVDAELVTEFAEDKVWEDNKEVFKNQLYVSGKQSFKISRCYGKVDVIITDSPICIGAIYNDSGNPHLGNCLLYEFNKYNKNALNYFINRVKQYNPDGRHQTEEEARLLDENLKSWLNDNGVVYSEVDGEGIGYSKIVVDVLRRLSDN